MVPPPRDIDYEEVIDLDDDEHYDWDQFSDAELGFDDEEEEEE